jgi:signal transduction histidine kinase
MMNQSVNWRELWPTLAGLGVAFVAALAVAIYVMQAPAGDLRDLVRFLLTSSIPSLVAGYAVFLIGRRWLRSIRLKVLLAYSLGIIIAVINIYVTSRLMFVSQHDFLLLGLLLIFAGLLSASFGYLLAVSISRSLRQLQAGANRLATGDFSARVHLAEVDELSSVASAFNIMADELEAAFARQRALEQARRDLTAAVSHDLRTPITSVRAMVEALTDGVVTEPEMVQRYYRNIRTQTENLSTLINDLFELSRLEAEQVDLELEPVDLNDLLSDVVESMQAQARARNISIRGILCEDLPLIKAEMTKIQRVLYNLVQNSLRHTPENGSIALETRLVPQGVQVDVTDTGEGIGPDDLPHVFDQFFRGEKSRSRETGGSGLGLAIAKRIIEAHHGEIWVASSPGAGAKFSFVLPVS